MKPLFKTILMTIAVLSSVGCEDWLGKNSHAAIYAEINGIPYERKNTDYHIHIHEYHSDGIRYGNCSFSIWESTLFSENGSEAQIELDFEGYPEIGSKYKIQDAFIGHNLEPGYYKSFNTSEGWVEITDIKKRLRDIVRIEGKFEFCVKYPSSDLIEVNVTNGRFNLPVFIP